jgi:hypothetical protein
MKRASLNGNFNCFTNEISRASLGISGELKEVITVKKFTFYD